MRLQTDPSCFSITAFLADQVTLVARHENLPPGAALLRIHDLSRSAEGRARLLGIIADAAKHETNPDEAAKIAAIHGELVAWGYGDALIDGHTYDNGRSRRAAA
ncbi:hypothetical protein [Azospirillum doebereinerae]